MSFWDASYALRRRVAVKRLRADIERGDAESQGIPADVGQSVMPETIGEFRVQRGYDTQSALLSRERSLSLDFLASYYVRPGTVVYVGYGSLLRGETARTLSVSHNNLFVKLSYLWQG